MGLPVALYLRPGEPDDFRRAELLVMCEQRGWAVVHEYSDLRRGPRHGLRQMLVAARSRRFHMLVVWDLDMLGRRTMLDVLHTMSELQDAGVGIFAFQQRLDTTTEIGRRVYQAIGVLAAFDKSLFGFGRPKPPPLRRKGVPGIEVRNPALYEQVRTHLLSGIPAWRVHKITGAGVSTVVRVKAKLTREGALVIPKKKKELV